METQTPNALPPTPKKLTKYLNYKSLTFALSYLKRHNRKYKICTYDCVSNDVLHWRELILISYLCSGVVFAKYFYRQKDKSYRIQGKRRSTLKVYTNKKDAKFIVFNGKRYYVGNIDVKN